MKMRKMGAHERRGERKGLGRNDRPANCESKAVASIEAEKERL